jgi:hypothetical protein
MQDEDIPTKRTRRRPQAEQSIDDALSQEEVTERIRAIVTGDVQVLENSVEEIFHSICLDQDDKLSSSSKRCMVVYLWGQGARSSRRKDFRKPVKDCSRVFPFRRPGQADAMGKSGRKNDAHNLLPPSKSKIWG